MSETAIAAYIRASTAEQTPEHQRESIESWLGDRDADFTDSRVTQYVDLDASGADPDREGFTELLADIEAGQYTDVVAWELSRLSREGETLQRFLNACEDTGTTLHLTDDNVETVRPDGTGRFIADVVAAVYQQERRTLIRRIEQGVRRARDQGKWLGEVPAGFERDDGGYLQVDLDAYLAIVDALVAVEDGASYNSAADGTPVTRQTLSAIHQDDDRRRWYTTGEADDGRVDEALGVVAHRHTSGRGRD